MSTRDAPSGTSMAGQSPGGLAQPPTDLELMLWLDGELDAVRAGEVADAVRRDPRARAVVAALRLASDAINDEALRHAEESEADQIADDVMEAIEAAGSRHLIVPIKRPPAWRAPVMATLAIAFAAAAAWLVIFPRELAPVALETSTPVPSSAEPESSATVSIDVVDFGARPGTIFYVPSEDESVLPVVWLTEDDSPSTEDTR
jgi:hypothetical protein